VNSETIVIVTGLPRSGTSMMMRMLEAGGLAPLTDHVRTADEDNPRGYYEFERVKDLPRDSSWVFQAHGKAVKVISALLRHLPPEQSYKVLFMRRELGDVLASQNQMLVRRGKGQRADDDRMAMLFRKHLSEVEAAIDASTSFDVMYVTYEDVVRDPVGQAVAVNEFVGGGLDTRGMADIVEPDLHRQQRGC
jgi:hypothetical protein